MEERKMILKMIEDGKISAEEGIKLLEAIDSSHDEKTKSEEPQSLSTEVKWDDESDEHRKRTWKQFSSENKETITDMFTSFFESTVQKFKEVDLDFNFGTAIEVDHIFQHRDVLIDDVHISLENGSMTIKPWDEQAVRVECQAKVYRVKEMSDARRYFNQHSNFKVDGNELIFKTKSKSMKVQATIYVPKATYAKMKLYTFNGQITGESLTVRTIDANALNGELNFSNIQAKKMSAETVNGAIRLNESKVEEIEAQTANGGITLEGHIYDVDAETLNGAIHYETKALTEAAYVDLKAMTGSIYVTVPQQLRIDGKLKTNVGSFSLQMKDTEIHEEKREFAQKSLQFVGNIDATPRVRINAFTNTGMIQVKDQ